MDKTSKLLWKRANTEIITINVARPLAITETHWQTCLEKDKCTPFYPYFCSHAFLCTGVGTQVFVRPVHSIHVPIVHRKGTSTNVRETETNALYSYSQAFPLLVVGTQDLVWPAHFILVLIVHAKTFTWGTSFVLHWPSVLVLWVPYPVANNAERAAQSLTHHGI